jgi:AcrR family transcriptional regulator
MAHRFAALWAPTPAPTRGRPAKINRDQIVDAAIGLADSDGLAAVSMRWVARQLGVGAMTLYSHLPGHDELVDAMVDRAYADFGLPEPGLDWRPALEQYAQGYWTLLRTHPWLLEVNRWRLPLAPHVFEAEEVGYRILVDTGLSPQQILQTIDVVNNLVSGAARAAAAELADEQRNGTSYEAYWAETSDFWRETFDPERFPTLTRLWSTGVFEHGATPFELRLEGLLDTVELLIERARQDGPAQIPSFDECMTGYDDRVAEELSE